MNIKLTCRVHIHTTFIALRDLKTLEGEAAKDMRLPKPSYKGSWRSG